MAMDTIVTGAGTGTGAKVDAEGSLQTIVPGYNSAGVAVGGGDVNGPAQFSEIDPGLATGARQVRSAEVDDDFRMRESLDTLMDQESFLDVAQNTNKFFFAGATSGISSSISGLLTNATNTTAGILQLYKSKAAVPCGGTQTYVCETAVAFTAQPVSIAVIEFGGMLTGTTAAVPLDGVFFRLNSAGLQGVVSANGAEVSTSVFPLSGGTGTYVYTNNEVHRYLIQATNVRVTFWIDNVLMGEIPTPSGLGFGCLSRGLQWTLQHRQPTTAGGVINALVKDYRVLIRGSNYSQSLGETGQRIHGCYAGLPGMTMGQLIAGTVTSGTLVKPTAAVPLNTSLAANLPNSLGGRIYETLTAGLAVNVDGIFASFQVPDTAIAAPQRRLKVTGIMLSGIVATAVTGGAANTEWYAAFGHTSASLATTETATFVNNSTKAPRRIMLPAFTQTITAAQAVNTPISQSQTIIDFGESSFYVNPGEFLALVGNRTATTAMTAGVLAYTYQWLYSWE